MIQRYANTHEGLLSHDDGEYILFNDHYNFVKELISDHNIRIKQLRESVHELQIENRAFLNEWIPGPPTTTGWCWLKFKNEWYKGNEKTEPEFINTVDYVISFSDQGLPRLRFSSNVHLIIKHCPIQEPEE